MKVELKIREICYKKSSNKNDDKGI